VFRGLTEVCSGSGVFCFQKHFFISRITNALAAQDESYIRVDIS